MCRYPFHSLRIPVLRATWKDILGRYFYVVERHTTVFAMMLDVLLLKVIQHEVGVIVFQVVKQYW